MSPSQGVPGKITVDQNKAWSQCLTNGWESISCHSSTQSPLKALILLRVKAKPSDQPTYPSCVPSSHLSATSPIIPLANSTPLSPASLYSSTLLLQSFCSCCAFYLELFPHIGAQLILYLPLRPLLRCSLLSQSFPTTVF